MSGDVGSGIGSLRNRANASNDCSFNNNSNNINNNNKYNNYERNNDFREESEILSSLKFESINNNSFIRSNNDKEERDLNEEEEEEDEEEEDEEDLDEDEDEKEIESSNDLHLSYCRGLSKTPLAVPMIADTLQQSVTRNDAKAITETRLKRLKELSQRPEEQLSKDQKDEKKRIIRLEKNRRAAAMSRRKKKIYVKSLEEKTQLMARHLAILEMENSHLRALLAATTQHQQHTLNTFKIGTIPTNTQHFQIPNIPNFMSSNNNNNNNSEIINNSSSATITNTTTNTTTNSSSSNTINNTIEPNMENNINTNINTTEPSLKRRRLNDGSSLNTITSSPSCDNSSDISILEPLPLPLPVSSTNNNINKESIAPPPAPPVPIQFMHVPQNHLLPPNIANIHPSRLIPYPPPHPVPHHNMNHELPPNLPRIPAHILNGEIIHPHHHINHNKHLLPKIIIDNDDNHHNINENGESKSVEIEEQRNNDQNNIDNDNNDDDNDMPPEIVVPRLSNEYLSILDDDIIDETVDECGSVIAFQQESKVNNVYL